MAFAMELIYGETSLDKCTPLFDDKYKEDRRELEKIVEILSKAKKTGLLVHEEKCSGCGNCVIACPAAPSLEPGTIGGRGPSTNDVVLKVVNGKVKVTNLEKCRRLGKQKTCRVCVEVCTDEAIEFV